MAASSKPPAKSGLIVMQKTDLDFLNLIFWLDVFLLVAFVIEALVFFLKLLNMVSFGQPIVNNQWYPIVTNQ